MAGDLLRGRHAARAIACLAAFAGCLLGASVSFAADVPFKLTNQTGEIAGFGKLENGHFTGHLLNRNFPIEVTGTIHGNDFVVQASGAICARGIRNAVGEGTAPIETGYVVVKFSASCGSAGAGEWIIVSVDLAKSTDLATTDASPPVTAVAGAPATDGLALDPVDENYIAIVPAKVRERPDVSAARVKTIEVGQPINVMGKLRGQDWYQVSENDRPIGFIIASQLVPLSQYHAANTAPASAPATTAAPAPAPQLAIPATLANLDFGNYQALVIGNDAYRNGLPVLKTAAGDAQAIAATLKNAYGFKVTVLTNATRAQIIGALAKLRESLTWDDNLLIYYAGHGSYDQDADQGYWLPVDAEPKDPTNWVSNTDLTNMLKAMQARHVMVVADSCYSGTLTRDANVGIQSADYIQRIVEKKARTVMTSGGLEPVSDSGGSGHSVFAAAFLNALQQNSGVMDAQAFFAKVREPVVLAAPQTPEYSNLRFAGHDGGDFVFVRRQ